MTFTEFKNVLILRGLEYFSRYYSIYRGSVLDNRDPHSLGRVKVDVPGIYSEPMDYWAWPRGLPAGKNFGLFAIPSVGDAVWVTFEGGDIRYPVWEGGWWKRSDVPESGRRTAPTNYLFQSPKGQCLELDDEKELVRMTNKGGWVLELNKSGISSGSKDKSKYKAVKGEELVEIMQELLTEIQKITVSNGGGLTSPPHNIAQFQEISTKLNKFLSDVNTLE